MRPPQDSPARDGSMDQVRMALGKFDKNGDMRVTLDEYIEESRNMMPPDMWNDEMEKMMRTAFDAVDMNKDGFWDGADMGMPTGGPGMPTGGPGMPTGGPPTMPNINFEMMARSAEDIMSNYDVNKNGLMEFDEYR